MDFTIKEFVRRPKHMDIILPFLIRRKFLGQEFSRPEDFASQTIREISHVLMEFNFANHQNLLISWELIFKILGFPQQKYW